MSKKATIIAVVNQKGGTGKTTTTENLGVGLALEGKKVLLVDTDPQASLEKLVATIRSREISACLVLQAQSQLKAIYKDNADTIIGNMDSRIFLGGSEPTTLKELNQALGKETIDTYNTSNTRGNSPSYGLNYQKLGKDMPYLFVKSSVALNLS